MVMRILWLLPILLTSFDPRPEGHNPAFWATHAGEIAFEGDDHGVAALKLLGRLPLVDGACKPFHPAGYADYVAWLRRADRDNLAYDVSTEFATAMLNLQHQYRFPSERVVALGTLAGGDTGMASLGSLVTETEIELAEHPCTMRGNPARGYQEALREALGGANRGDGLGAVAGR
jgi:hypothetical protein